MTDTEDVRLTEIARAIESADSPVGIDAKKTHVLILRALERIEERVARLEAKLDAAPRVLKRPPSIGGPP
jgi:hypothetical protein